MFPKLYAWLILNIIWELFSLFSFTNKVEHLLTKIELYIRLEYQSPTQTFFYCLEWAYFFLSPHLRCMTEECRGQDRVNLPDKMLVDEFTICIELTLLLSFPFHAINSLTFLGHVLYTFQSLARVDHILILQAQAAQAAVTKRWL